ncbi:MAG: SPOR domain-containing protein [Halomonas subglaciescola]|nr:SPOR domain-containing protein [Halomonas subglaciescola]
MATQRKKPTRRGATSQRKKPAKAAGGFRLPGWLWALLGLVAGFFLAQHQNGTAPWQDTAPPKASPAPSDSADGRDGPDTAAEAEEDDDGMPTFEFYTLLPETEVIAPGGAVPSSVTPPSPSASSDASDAGADPIAQVIAAKSRSEEKTPTVQHAPTEPGHYMLQAASFREIDDARELSSRLKNLSLLAKISEVKASGVTWHRVQVGPYEDPHELSRAQDLMSTQGIEPLLIQLQD